MLRIPFISSLSLYLLYVGWYLNKSQNTLEIDWGPDTSQIDSIKGLQDSMTFANLSENRNWMLVFEDSCTDDWRQHWTLDGQKAKVENSDQGMHFRAGPEFKNDADHAVLWTKPSFEGDVKIEYSYTRTDSETRCVNILYIQATGHGEGPYAKDISKWSELRRVPVMRTYYENMNTLHISYAAFPNSEDSSSYIRARRYPALAKNFGEKTKIAPSYDKDGFFKPGETYQITALKTGSKLFFHMKGKDGSKLFSWDLRNIKPIKEGRIGLRHMYTRSAIYKDFKVYTSPS